MSGVTRSGRVFEAPNPLVRSKDAKGKAKVGTKESDEASSILNEEIPVERFVQKDGDFGGKKISTEEENEFLRIIQQSEFKVIEQLNKTPARVSLLELLMNSKPHWELLFNIYFFLN